MYLCEVIKGSFKSKHHNKMTVKTEAERFLIQNLEPKTCPKKNPFNISFAEY